jgi:two-component system OmpR family response regulator
MIHIARVLVVDVNPDTSDTMSAMLKLCGFDCESQISAEGGLNCAARKPPQIALADLRMPSMHGFEFARRLQEVKGCRRTPVIFISGYRIEESRIQARALGHEFFAKPVELHEILKAMHETLDRRSEAAAFDRDDCEGCDVRSCGKWHAPPM